MSESKIVICDNCKTQSLSGVLDSGIINTPLKWFKLYGMIIRFRNKINKKDSNKGLEEIRLNDVEIDLCSKECALEWFEKQIDNLISKK